MIQFAQAQYLLLIFATPLFFLFYWLYRRGRKRKIEALGDPRLLGPLMPTRSRAKGWVRVTFFSVAWFFFVIGLARPQLGARLKESEKKGAEIMIALDVSNSMLAEDYSPNRLERAKLAISRLVDKLQGDRIGLIVFAGQSFVQLPITTDYVSAKIFLNSISTESVPVQGTALGDAIYTAIKSFSSEALMSKDNKAIILITDGENHEDDPVQAAKDANEMGIKVFCIGVGSAEGKPIPIGSRGELLKDREGNIVVTRLDEKTLEEIAAAGGGAYVRAGNTEFGLNPIIDDIKELEQQQFKSVVFEDFDEQYMYFFAIALVFLILEFLIGKKRIGKRFFALSAILMFTLVQGYAQTDKKEVRKGNKLFGKEDYKGAEVEYRKALIKDSASVAAQYNLANTLYKMKNTEEAAKTYAPLADSLGRIPRSSSDIKKASDYYHNVGNTFLEEKKYGEAVEAYKNSLRRNPADMETKANLAYAQKKLEDQQNQQNQQNQNDQNNQDQNQDQNKDRDQDNKDDQNKNQDNKNNQDQNGDQDRDKNDQNKNDPDKNDRDGNKNGDSDKKDRNDPQQNRGNSPKITPQTAEQMLQAVQEKENATQEKVKKEKAKLLQSKQKIKNW